MNKLNLISRSAVAISALLMVSAYFVPLWQILMWAPQYPEGLDMKIWINNITGDVKIISALNHYIGMRHIEVGMFPEFGYMVYILAFMIAFGIGTALINRRFMLVIYAALIVACGVAALVDFYMWGYDYGHNLDPTAAIVVPGMSYQPPFIGTKQLLNFTAFSGPDIGGWIFMVAGVLVLGALAFEIYRTKKKKASHAVVTAVVFALLLTKCTVEPEALHYGKDGCSFCKMTLMDQKFGAEVLTHKGKIYKFDDVNCMLQFIHSEIKEEEIKDFLIVDFATPAKLIDAKNAFYVKSEKVMSPMAGNIAAFESADRMKDLNKQWKGILLSWGELKTEFK